MTNSQHTTEEEPRTKRRGIVAALLAVLAVGGIGAAVTSAAWTDNVFYSADATAAEFNLQGSLDGATWVESDNKNAIEIVVPASAFDELLPGEDRDVTLWVKNDSTVDATLAPATFEWDGATFAANPTVAILGAPTTLTPGQEASFTLNLTTPADWADANQGETGTIIVTLQGTAS